MERKSITGYHLKLIALITMLIDHIGAILIYRLLTASYSITGTVQQGENPVDMVLVWFSQNQNMMWEVYDIMRLIGRIAFPIYCFLLVEGFLHTSNVKKYAVRLGVFALISEVPFDLALHDTPFEWGYNNVFFTLLIGLLMCWGLSYVEKFYDSWKGKWILIGADALIFLAAALIAEYVVSSDYGMAGIAAIFILYVFRQNRNFAFAMSVIALTFMSSSTEIVAMLGMIPLMRYDGSRGKSMKYVFYVFYPAHLLVLALVCMLFGV